MTTIKDFRTDYERWKAVEERNPAADGRFYYSVKTTGVYCRPSCASRLARRENVRFYSSCEDAEAAGFRPCKRCQPKNASFGTENAAIVTRICRLIELSTKELALKELASHAGMSPFHFQRLFKKLVGVTPKSYSIAHRSTNLKKKLRKTKSVTEAIFESGFKSNGQFYATSNKRLGMTPKKFRSGAEKLNIRYVLGKCSLGKVLVGVTEKGICAIFLGDSNDELIQQLKTAFHKAMISPGDKSFVKSITTVIRFVDRPTRALHLPLDIRGTAFQQRVWQALQKIPVGSITTYAEIARKIGDIKSVRAIARACAMNTIAIAIPCHRVIRSDGNLAGYRWGIERKQNLLEREKKH